MSRTTVGISLALAMFLTGCAHSGTESTTATETSSPEAVALDTPEPAAAGTAENDATASSGHGHIVTTGSVVLEHDFKIAQCLISKPGRGLIGGYQMHAETPEIIVVRESDYTKDGTYVVKAKSEEEQVPQAVNQPTAGALQLMISAGDKELKPVTDTPQSTLEITISGDGAKGEAKFTKFQDQMAALMDPAASHSQKDFAPVSGTSTWSCAKVDRLGNADAINSAVKDLTSH